MGILSIFKRKKKAEDELLSDVGLPPLPPTKTSFTSPDLLLDLPEIPTPPKKDLPPLKKFPSLPSMPSLPTPKTGSRTLGEALPIKKVNPEKLKQRVVLQTNEPIFVSSHDFRYMLGDLAHLKSIFRDAQDFASRLADYEQDREKNMDALRRQIATVQRKLIVADKSLFR